MRSDLVDHVIIITGASAGIGAATARACAAAGMRVVLAARRADRLDALRDEIDASGRRAIALAGDVTDDGFSERLLDAAEQAFGRCDAVLANAGYGLDRLLHEMSVAEHRAIFETNYFAACDLLQRAARRWIAAGHGGHLLMTSSCLARFTMPRHGAYCATKAAQHHFCRAMGMELRRYGIRVSSVHPIGTRTEFFDVMSRQAGASGAAPGSADMPRLFLQSPERVARAIVKCLRRPRPEVWTSLSVRLLAAWMAMFPRVMDWVGAAALRDERRAPAGDPG
ncbi:MAG: SDR family NAD(P)-dependent oxidoreductase [Planctomycetota bacterium]|nr:MAG: SDR family NAD(P)-dependent oxidoreductase [Planctomycetota bacterium]